MSFIKNNSRTMHGAAIVGDYIQ
ncbi:hypothetical protein DRJ53_06675 [Paracnuella aquatica]|nr:hypothetical protein DRJ53_06675 [Paracnuella aquatica]